MVLKCGNLFTCIGASFSYGKWEFSNVSLYENNTLKIEICSSTGEDNSRTYRLSPEWFIINPKPTSSPNCPPLPEHKKQEGLFALTQPSEITIWFLASSKYERNLWLEKILPIITLNPPTPPEPPPPYSEYDNLSYFPWDINTRTEADAKGLNSFTLPRPSIHNRSGFYSLEKPIKRPPKPVEPIPKLPEPPPPSEPPIVSVQSRDSSQCVNCFALGCAFICNTLSVCLQMCCNNFNAAF